MARRRASFRRSAPTAGPQGSVPPPPRPWSSRAGVPIGNRAGRRLKRAPHKAARRAGEMEERRLEKGEEVY